MRTSAPPKLILDRAKFPMIWVSALDGYLHCLPVAKIQFEYFLCDTTEARFGEEFYETLLKRNARVSPGAITEENYYQAFATGIKPDEARAFCEWCSADRDELFDLPSRKEWYAAWRELKTMPPLAIDDLLQLGLSARVTLLFRRLEAAAARLQGNSGERSLADSLLLHRGVYEWVRCEDNSWAGAGMPHPALGAGIIVLDHEKPREFVDLESRPHGCGFRLLKRGG
jgi:hypothetical protein